MLGLPLRFLGIRLCLTAVLFALMPLAAARAEGLQLVMVEQPGCIYCARWNAQLGEIYPLTPEGKAAPLVRLDLHDPLPEGMRFARKAVFTPTFVLVQDGQELERIEGYPGEDFFWGLLGVMLKNAGVATDGT